MSEPQYLYHYTTFEGLKGIIDSKNLWFSDYRSMSDTKEFIHSEGLIKDCIEAAIKKFMRHRKCKNKSGISQDEIIRNLIEDRDYLWTVLLKPLQESAFEAYLFCFCVHGPKKHENGLLSMWRGYGGKGGYSIAFKRKKLYQHLKKIFASHYPAYPIFTRVAYLKDQVPSTSIPFKIEWGRLNKFIEEKLLPSWWDKTPMSPMTSEEFEAILTLIAFIKHPGFHEEREYRLCLITSSKDALPSNKKQPTLKPRIRKRESYIEFPIFKLEDLVEEIIIGPQSDVETKREFLKGYLKTKGLSKINVRTSEIPYLPR